MLSMNRMIGYPLLIMAICAGLPAIYGMMQIVNLDFAPLKQNGFILQGAGLMIVIAFFAYPVRAAIDSNELNIKHHIFIAVMALVIAYGGLYTLNKYVVVKTFDRTAVVTAKSLVNRISARTTTTRQQTPINVVTVPSCVDQNRSVSTIIDAGMWQTIKPNITKANVRTEIGITGIEFATVLAVN